MEPGKEIIWYRLKKYLLKSLAHEMFYDKKSNLYNVFILKCVSATNISIVYDMEGVIR